MDKKQNEMPSLTRNIHNMEKYLMTLDNNYNPREAMLNSSSSINSINSIKNLNPQVTNKKTLEQNSKLEISKLNPSSRIEMIQQISLKNYNLQTDRNRYEVEKNNLLKSENSNYLLKQSMDKSKILDSPTKKIIVPGTIKLSPIIHPKHKSDKSLPNGRELLQKIKCDTKILRKFAVMTQPGQHKGVTKVNQDNYLILDKILDIENFSIFGVFDGHGYNGHYISEIVKNSFSRYFTRSEIYYIPRSSYSIISGLPSLKNYTNEKEIYQKLIRNEYELIRQAFDEVENEIKESQHDSEFSGTTCCLVFLLGEKLICANVGDSRGILVNELGKQGKANYQIKINQISNDHKPESPEEKQRILKNGGVVKKINEFGVNLGPQRVWLKDENYPGLAMSRSLGDFVAKTIGVIYEPEILEYDLSSHCKSLIIASDGVWEYMTNEHVAKIVSKFHEVNEPQSATEQLVSISTQCWIEVKNLKTLKYIYPSNF
jgi:serine/threonine protein phosphatase PrpC